MPYLIHVKWSFTNGFLSLDILIIKIYHGLKYYTQPILKELL